MSKLIVDTIQTNGGVELNLPSADGTAGQTIQTDGSGNLSFATPSTGSYIESKVFDLSGSSYSDAGTKVRWTDVKAGVDTDKIAAVRITGHVRATTNFTCRVMGCDASGNAITSGYMGYMQAEWYNGSNQSFSNSHNSNNGYIWWPGYTTAYGSNSNSYGNGIHFTYTMIPQTDGNRTGHFHKIEHVYQQDTSYDYPNGGTMSWNNYGSSTPPATWHGFSMYPSSGSWDTGTPHGARICVELMIAD